MGDTFVGNFLGEDDEWKNDKNKTFVNREKIESIFKDFEIVYFNERRYNKMKISTGKVKFWHVYDLIAKKKQLT